MDWGSLIRFSTMTYMVDKNDKHIICYSLFVIKSLIHVIFSGYYRRCIYIWTNMTDHVIKLEEKDFQIENSIDCDADSLTIYYTSFEDAGKH